MVKAAKKGVLAQMSALIGQRVEYANLADEHGFTPLWAAARSEHNAGEMVRTSCISLIKCDWGRYNSYLMRERLLMQ